MIAPSPLLSAYGGGFAVCAAPSQRLVASGSPSTNGATIEPPSPTLAAFSGARATLTAPLQLLSASGTVMGMGSVAAVAPTPTLLASGTASGVGRAALSPPIASLVGYFGAVASVSITGRATLVASGTSGAVGVASLTAPLFALTASGTRQNSGSALLTAPVGYLATTGAAWLVAPGATLTAIGSATITATYEAYALNLNHTPRRGQEDPVDEMTRYTNFPFTHVVRYQNSYFGANSTGLYLLEGTTDDAVAIPWDVQTHMTDFDSAQKKTVEMAYFGGRMGSEAVVSLHVGEVGPTTYNYTTPRGATAQNYRQAFGRGLKARYYAFGMAGDGELSIDSITFNVAITTRKV